MTTAERLLEIDKGVEKTKALNAELEQTLYGTDTGGKSFYDAFWDGFTHNGKRTSYYRPFAQWGHVYIRPKTKIVPLNTDCGHQTFNACSNLKKIEANWIDFSQKPRGTKNTEGYYYTFYNCVSLEEIEDVGIQPDYGFTYAFANDEKLHTIAIIRCDENTTFPNAFNYCKALVNLVIEGTIGKNINLQWSKKLTLESLVSILTHLFNFNGSGEEWSRTIILAVESWDLLNAQGAVATNPVTGEACTWVEYVEACGWLRE